MNNIHKSYNSDELIIETKDLNFSFNGKHKILKSLNLKIEKGSIYGFLGPNGAGKTTTIRLLLGLLNYPKNSIHPVWQRTFKMQDRNLFKNWFFD